MSDEEPTTYAIPPSRWALSDEDPSGEPGAAQVGSPKEVDVESLEGNEKAPLLGSPRGGGSGSPRVPSAPPYPEQVPYAGPLGSGQAPYAPPPPVHAGPRVEKPAEMGAWCTFICLLNLGCVALLAALGASAADPRALGGAFAACYVAYLVTCCCSPTGRSLRNVMDQSELDAYVRRLRAVAPVVEATISCYHYETRHRTERWTETDKDGNTHHRHRHVRDRVRVDTHFAREAWRYAWCRDVSGPPVYQPTISALRVRIKAVQDFTGASARALFDSWRDDFYRRNTCDLFQDRTCKMMVPGLESFVMLRKEKGGLLSPEMHALATLLLCGGLYEAVVAGEVPTTRWLLVKQLHA